MSSGPARLRRLRGKRRAGGVGSRCQARKEGGAGRVARGRVGGGGTPPVASHICLRDLRSYLTRGGTELRPNCNF